MRPIRNVTQMVLLVSLVFAATAANAQQRRTPRVLEKQASSLQDVVASQESSALKEEAEAQRYAELALKAKRQGQRVDVAFYHAKAAQAEANAKRYRSSIEYFMDQRKQAEAQVVAVAAGIRPE